MATVEQRVSYVEGKLDSLATKEHDFELLFLGGLCLQLSR